MIEKIVRKVRRFAEDPVLRRWVLGVTFRRFDRLPPFEAHRPPYLADVVLPIIIAPLADNILSAFGSLSPAPLPPTTELPLAGEIVQLRADQIGALFERYFSDTETLLSLHRFAWLPLVEPETAAAWLEHIWREWSGRFAEPDGSWAWHPYTTAERAINILDFALIRGLPGERDATLRLLACHVPAIASNLEYFGDHDTSNHLSNNGRGLYRLGLALGLPAATEIGRRILLHESARIFLPSGVLREGSSHYHLLLTRNYLDAWLAARRHQRPEAVDFETTARRLLAILPHLALPGGLPLIGDISPDCPPEFLYGLLPGGNMCAGWCAGRDDQDRAALVQVVGGSTAAARDRLNADGWWTHAAGPWNALWYVAPDGWPPMPGHAHNDMGSGEIHYEGVPLVVDCGRGAYGETGEAGFYTSAAAHNSLTIDEHNPYPPNKPYYNDMFRRAICGANPQVSYDGQELRIAHRGFSRLGAVGEAVRRFTFADRALAISDRIEGRGSRQMRRRIFTPWPTEIQGGKAIISTPVGHFQVSTDGGLQCRKTKRWIAYGRAADAWVIESNSLMTLPADLKIMIEKVAPS